MKDMDHEGLENAIGKLKFSIQGLNAWLNEGKKLMR